MKFGIALALSAAALVAANPASATATIGDLSSAGFTYGTLTDTGFTAYTAYPAGASQCLGLGNCYRGSDTYAIIAQSNVPGALLVHPGPGAGGNSAVRYTVTAAGTYNLSALFTSADKGTKSVGYFTIIGGILSSYGIGSVTGGGNPPTDPFGSSLGVNTNVTLGADDSFGIFVNNGNGDYYNDSTNVAGTISAVPEAATWAMMLLGFGMAGFGMRYRRRSAVRVTYA